MGSQLGHLSVHDVLILSTCEFMYISYILYITGYILYGSDILLYGSDLPTYVYRYK